MRCSFTVLAHLRGGDTKEGLEASLCTHENQYIQHMHQGSTIHRTLSLAVGQLNQQYYSTVVKRLSSEFMLPRIKSWFTPDYSLPWTGSLTLYICFLTCKMGAIIVSNLQRC